MMDAIRKYLISLCAAALLCALVRALVPGGRMKKLCSLLCGIFLMTAALSGISGWQLSDFAQELSKMQVAAEQARTGVEIRNREALCAIIKSKTEAYIWDKAQELDLSVSIEVMVEADGSYPYPSGVQITGAFTPQQRKTLEAYIEENLAIGKTAFKRLTARKGYVRALPAAASDSHAGGDFAAAAVRRNRKGGAGCTVAGAADAAGRRYAAGALAAAFLDGRRRTGGAAADNHRQR